MSDVTWAFDKGPPAAKKFTKPGQHSELPPADPDLIAVITSWATLPAAIKVGIMAMVGASDDKPR